MSRMRHIDWTATAAPSLPRWWWVAVVALLLTTAVVATPDYVQAAGQWMAGSSSHAVSGHPDGGIRKERCLCGSCRSPLQRMLADVPPLLAIVMIVWMTAIAIRHWRRPRRSRPFALAVVLRDAG